MNGPNSHTIVDTHHKTESTNWGGTIVSAVNLFPRACVNTLPNEMSVLPVPAWSKYSADIRGVAEPAAGKPVSDQLFYDRPAKDVKRSIGHASWPL